MELPLLEGGVYICCPSSEEEVSLDFDQSFWIDPYFTVELTICYSLRVSTLFQSGHSPEKTGHTDMSPFSINVSANVLSHQFHSINVSTNV